MSAILPPRHGSRPARMRIAASAVIIVLCATQAEAQARAAAPPKPPASAPANTPAPPETRAPYEPQLLRLAKIIGALAYLRDLCGDHDGDKWRAKMASLLAAEQGAPDSERQRLAGAYNEGFHGYALTYRTCTANARIIIERDLAEGQRLTRDVENRYGGG